jgi:serine/threonine protein kinase
MFTQVLKRFRHPNIVALYGYNITAQENCQFLVYEYLVNGALSGFLMDDQGRSRLPAHIRISIMFQVGRAVNFLHTGACDNLEIFHRDIKSGNICLTQDFTAKLIDCGMSTFAPKDKNVSHGKSVTSTIRKAAGASYFGTPGYICPNYLRRSGRVPFTAKCDVYSLGVVFAELIVGCLQDGQSSRNGQDFDDFYNRYVVDDFGGKVENGLEQLIGDADPLVEWNASSLKLLCELTLTCMAPNPVPRPTTHDLITMMGEISKTDFQGSISSKVYPSESDDKLPVKSLEDSTTSSCVLCHETVVDSILCSKMHAMCVPCVEQGIQNYIVGSGDELCCEIVGCNAPFMDDFLHGKISQLTFKEYVTERGRKKYLEQKFKALEVLLSKNQMEVVSSLNEIKSVTQRSLRALAYLATESVKKCPTLIWMVPAEPIVGRSPQDLVNWATNALHRRYHVYFVCQHSFVPVDIEPKIILKVPRCWMVQVAPVLRLTIFAMKAALSAMGPLPFPIPDILPKEQLLMNEQLVNSFLDDTTAKLLEAFESTCSMAMDIPHIECSNLMRLTGPAYDAIEQKALKEKRIAWTNHMEPVRGFHGQLIWVKKKYKDLY